jgi:chromosome segregation protein
VRLKRLIVQGFKSFKDRTTIHFQDGITGIVGPNGCGKSNVVDAIFWVMGEQSAKHLRGNSMQDVIFSGSEKYKPASWAEVSLVLDNSELKHIHIGNSVTNPSEIQLTRKLYRNGESDFRINDIPCRLKDIQEVFMDTGAGAKSYSVIAQGEINKLVQAKPHELRTMVEEVAGITKFKIRKKESLRKIEQTQLNLNRLSDIKNEIETNLNLLEKQAEKAFKAKGLKEKIKNNEILVFSNKVVNLLKDFQDGKQFKISGLTEIEAHKTKVDTYKIEKEKDQITKEELVEKINEFQEEYNKISKELAAKEERYKNLKEKKEEKEKGTISKNAEILEIEKEKTERESKLSATTESLSKLLALNSHDHDLPGMEKNLLTLKAELDQKNQTLSLTKKEISEKTDQLNTLEREMIKNDSSLEEYSRQLQNIAKEREELETKHSSFSGEISLDRDLVNKAQDKYLALEKEELVLKEKIKDFEEKFAKSEESFKKAEKELTELESVEKSLLALNESFEGFQEGAGLFLKSKYSNGLTPIGNLIKCDAKYTKAVESLMVDFTETIWGENLDLDSILKWYQENKDKGLDFLLDVNPNQENFDLLFDEIHSILDIAKVPTPELLPLFSGMYIVPKLTSKEIASLSGKKFRAISSLDGEIVVKNTPQGIILNMRPKRGESVALIERNNRISEIQGQLESKRENLTQIKEKFLNLKNELEGYRTKRESVRTLLTDSKVDFAGKSSSLDTKIRNIETNKSRFDLLKNKEVEISQNRLTHLEKQDGQKKSKEKHLSEIEFLTQNFRSLDAGYLELNARYEKDKQDFYELKIAVGSFDEKSKTFKSQIEDLKGQIQKLDLRYENNKVQVLEFENILSTITGEIIQLEKENKEMAQSLKDKEDILGIRKDELEEIEKVMSKREKDTQNLISKINKAEKELAQMDVKLEQYIEEEADLTKNAFEKHQIDVRESAKNFLNLSETDSSELKDISSIFFMETQNGPVEIKKETFEFSKRYPNELKEIEVKLNNYRREYNNLGDINWQAIGEYEKQKVRFDFLKNQEMELVNSLEDLRKAIDHIDHKSKERFEVAYREIAEKFSRIFPIVFGGGHAELRLVGSIDDPECGVDIFAQPMGKKTQNISLMSGGEKALTAVSLLFAIFLIKPSPFVLLDEVDAPLDEANVGRFNDLLKELSNHSQFILITHNKKTMSLNDTLYGITMQEPGVSKCVSVHLH